MSPLATAFTGLLSLAALATASPVKKSVEARQNTFTRPSGTHIWQVSDLTFRKLNGRDINSISFQLSTTNSSNTEIDCSPHRLTDGEQIDDNNFRENTIYRCNDDDEGFRYQFSYSQVSNRLLIRETEDVVTIGATTVPNTCRAGGSSNTDMVCTQSGEAYVVLANYDDYRCQINTGDNDDDNDNDDNDNDNDNNDDNDDQDEDNDDQSDNGN